jgi:hypothetical protein
LTELWLPGPHGDFVDAMRRRIEAFAEEHGAAVVEVELRDGSTFAVSALEPEPGSGFVTLVPHGDEPREIVVPVISLARITLSGTSEAHPLGFAVPPAG